MYMIPMARADSIQPRFIEMLTQEVGFTASEVDAFLPFWEAKCLRKKEHFLSAGDVCNSMNYVNKGCLRRYVLAENGKESILNFAIEDWWIGDLESMHTRKPSPYYIQALEDSELLLLDRSRAPSSPLPSNSISPDIPRFVMSVAPMVLSAP